MLFVEMDPITRTLRHPPNARKILFPDDARRGEANFKIGSVVLLIGSSRSHMVVVYRPPTEIAHMLQECVSQNGNTSTST
jgi:hypothetical protein